MFVSPTRWFNLLDFITFRSTLSKSTSETRFGRLQIRAMRLVVSVLTGWMILASFGVTDTSASSDARPGAASLNSWLCVSTSVGVIGCGVVMLLRPNWWIAKYFKEPALQGHESVLVWILRLLCVPCIGVGIYFLLQCRAIR